MLKQVQHDSLAAVKQPCVYILASQPCGTLYIGVTSDLVGRLYLHRTGQVKGFTSRYGVYLLVRFELFETMYEAISREKQLKALAPAVEDQPDRERESALD